MNHDPKSGPSPNVRSLNHNILRFDGDEDDELDLPLLEEVSGGTCIANRPVGCPSLCDVDLCDTHSCTCNGGAIG